MRVSGREPSIGAMRVVASHGLALLTLTACHASEPSRVPDGDAVSSAPAAQAPASNPGGAPSIPTAATAARGAAGAGGRTNDASAGAGAGRGGSAGSAGAASAPVPTAPYAVVIHDAVRIQSHDDQPNFQNAIAEVDFGAGPFARATLEVQLQSTCVPFSRWEQNPPPAGQSWPADCDRFDRNFEIVLDPQLAPDAPAGIELVRAITPYGGPMQFEVDVTDIVNARPGKHRIRTHIATWSDDTGEISGSAGGWNVTATLQLSPGTAPRPMLAVVPLADVTIEPAQSSGEWAFELPAGAAGVRFEYRATGHGGANVASTACRGAAEEFCRREHTLALDGMEFARLDAWRDDCGQPCTIETGGPDGRYCRENPCRAIANVTNPRANWCPGSITPPLTEENAFSRLKPGAHRVRYSIGGFSEGGIWRLSAHLLVYAP